MLHGLLYFDVLYIAEITEQTSSVTSKVTNLLRRTVPGDDEVTTPFTHHKTTIFTNSEMETSTTATAEDDRAEPVLLSNDAVTDGNKTPPPPSQIPKLCINDVEVNLSFSDDHAASLKTTTIATPAAVGGYIPSIFGPLCIIPSLIAPYIATPAVVKDYVPSIFGPRLITAPHTPPPSYGVNASSTSHATAVVSTAPVQARGLITPIFSSNLSGYSMFNKPSSTIPCKREGSPLVKDEERTQHKT